MLLFRKDKNAGLFCRQDFVGFLIGRLDLIELVCRVELQQTSHLIVARLLHDFDPGAAIPVERGKLVAGSADSREVELDA